MPVYLITPLVPDAGRLDMAVERRFSAADRYQLQAGRGWLVRFDGTTIEASNKIGITGQAKGEPAPLGSALVVPVTSYYGRGPTDMWEWLKTRLET